MARTLRVYIHQTLSRWFHFNWGIQVDPYPVVHISVSEAWLEGTLDPLSGIHPIKNDTVKMYVKNVVPQQNSDGTLGVDFYIEIDWPPYKRNICVDITVLESVEQGWIASHG